MTLFTLQDVTRTVRIPDAEPLTILTGVNLSVEPGDRVSIVGRSGSGKSTLLNLLGLLDIPTTGTLFFDGDDVRSMSQRRRDRVRGQNIGFIFQQFNLLEGRTALENVATPLLYANASRFWRRDAIAAEMLERVGLGHRMNSLPTSLSGGEQQRVAIARALVREPRVILADEPTGALDLETGRTVMELLDEVVRDRGAALVTITHDPGIAERSDRHYRLDSGILTALDDDVYKGSELASIGVTDAVTASASAGGAAVSAAEPEVGTEAGADLDAIEALFASEGDA